MTVTAKANIYFEGKAVSHAIKFGDGSKKTLELICPGSYCFNIAAAENMAIVDGDCKVKIKGKTNRATYTAGQAFDIPTNSSFQIAAESGIAQYNGSFV